MIDNEIREMTSDEVELVAGGNPTAVRILTWLRDTVGGWIVGEALPTVFAPIKIEVKDGQVTVNGQPIR